LPNTSPRRVAAAPHGDTGAQPLRVLRLCSVFEAPDEALTGRGVRFDVVGGMQNHTSRLTRALDRRGVRQHVVTHRPPGAPASYGLGRDATVHRFGLPIPWVRQLYAGPAAVAALALAHQADLVHAHLGEDLAVLPIGVAAARRASAPLVVTVHCSLRHTFAGSGPRAWLLKTIGGAIEAAAYRRADAVIVVTPRLAAHLREDGTCPDRIHVIPPGISSPADPGDLVDPVPHLGRPRVLYIGRLNRPKGVHTLVEAASLMRTPNVRVLLVGDGPARASLERSIQRRGLADRVHITGFRPQREIAAFLRHADVVCLPSHYEELGSVLLDAMQAQVPIVASNTGGIPDAVGLAARLVSPGEAAALAEAIDTVLGDRALARRLASLGTERAGVHDWEHVASRVLDVYRLVLRNRTAGSRNPRRRAYRPASSRAHGGRYVV
jgi:glycogen synthase